MIYFRAKHYQQHLLNNITEYFINCHKEQSPNKAFLLHTGVAYEPLKGFNNDMPYFCLRVPTGGGKTWLAASSIQYINSHLLRTQHSVILWLVPSNQIKQQTLKGLKNREHPLYSALLTAGAITVLDLNEAKSITPATLNTSTTIIVATRQAFQVENEENRKVYESSGALMAHFSGINNAQKQQLLTDAGVTPYSLANVLRLRRPFVIVDEAHNSRTELGFDTLAKLNPSGIMELTATPDLIKTPSNVLHSISAVELKNEQMIKLPIRLETQAQWQQCLADAITCREDLQYLADKEYLNGADYLRPIVLIQAEAKHKDKQTLDVFCVKQELMSNHNIADNEIIIATGEEKGLMQLAQEYKEGILDKNCPVKFVITQKALAEGWDCPFAYILVSMANVHSSTAVEQLLGRILRQPNATRRKSNELNQSYAFVVSNNFTQTASALRDTLVNSAGFERKAVTEFIKPIKSSQMDLDLFKQRTISPISTQLIEAPQIPKTLKEKVIWHEGNQTLSLNAPLTEQETQLLIVSVEREQSKQSIIELAQQSRDIALEFFKSPAERGALLRVPQLTVPIQGELQLFDDPQMLDYPWDLSRYEAKPSESDTSLLKKALNNHSGGELDIIDGRVIVSYLAQLQRNLDLVYIPENWDTVKLAVWLCDNIYDATVSHQSKLTFILAWLENLLNNFSLVDINQHKFLVRELIEQHINNLRQESINRVYQQVLFDDCQAQVNEHCVFEFPQYYAPTRYYEGKYGRYQFEHHYYAQLGDFDSKEEFECACYLDQLAAHKKINYWLRNLSRSGFFLQKATDRFYPDFICVLPNEVILIVEYKGENGWKNAEDDRHIGQLWAEMSNNQCLFIMITKKRWDLIDALLF